MKETHKPLINVDNVVFIGATLPESLIGDHDIPPKGRVSSSWGDVGLGSSETREHLGVFVPIEILSLNLYLEVLCARFRNANFLNVHNDFL